MRVLLVEDDGILGEAIRDHVAGDGHAVDWARTLAEAAEHLAVIGYALILLDLQLPDGPGLDLLRQLRRDGNDAPAIILTARDQISDRISGLNSGADDYLVKPFDLAELSARIAAVARRYARQPSPELRIGHMVVDQTIRRLVVDGDEVALSSREWAVLEQFLRRPGATVSKRQIEDALYEFGAEIESNTVEVYVSRLRRKIGRDAITTIRGLGYQMSGR